MATNISKFFEWNWHALPVAAVSTVILFIGLFIFIQNPRAVANRTFFLICLCVNFWLYGIVLLYFAKTEDFALAIYRTITFLGVSYVSPCVYSFSAVWLKLYKRQKKWIWAGLAGAGIFYLVGLFSSLSFVGVRRYFWGFYPQYGPINAVFIFFFFAYFFASFYNFIKAYREEPVGSRRIQIRLIAIGFLISLTGSVDYLPKLFYMPVYPIGYISVFIWIMMVAYAIVKYKVMDIQTAIHKTIMWFASTVVAIMPFALIIYLTENQTRQLPPVYSTAYFLALLVGFYFYFRAIQPRLDHIFQRRRSNLQAILVKFSEELVHLKNLRDVLQGFARLLRRTFYTRRVSIYLRDKSDQELVPAIVKRSRGLKPVSLQHPFLQWLEKCDAVVVGELAQSDPETEPFKEAMRDYFLSMEAVVVVPFVLGGKLIGVAHLGAKENFRKYTSQEIHFLKQLKSPVTIAFSNSLRLIAMQESLQQWNDELERKVVERTNQLQQTQAQLVQAEKLATIGTLSGGIAHEINNPLTAVLTNAQILKMTASPDDLESISLIEEGAKRCQGIIQKLMKYARKPMGKEVVGRVDVNKVVSNVIAFLDYQLKQENIELVVEQKDNLSSIEGNSNELEQVVTNLILNAKDAIKQTEHNGKIKIMTMEENGSVDIVVSDNGVGIPKENLTKIFDPFFTTKDVGKGTGLGLAVTYGIVEKHKGRIKVTSDVGLGTTFEVVLPK